MSNALVVQTDLTKILGGIDFNSLNASIDKMANANTSQMEEDQRKYAVQIIDDWNYGVVGKLNEYLSRVNNFLAFFGADSKWSNVEVDEDMREQLAVATSNQALWQVYLAANQEVEDFVHQKPVLDIDEPNMTTLEIAQAKSEHEAALRAYNIRIERKQQARRVAHTEFVRALNKDAKVEELLKQAKRYKRNYKKFVEQCKDKSMLAKTNIMIPDATLREAIKELVEFSIKL